MTDNPQNIRGSREGAGRRFVLVAGEYEREIVDLLIEGAIDALTRHGVSRAAIRIVRVPGAWEVPPTCARILERGKADGIVALGCVIRGETAHFDFIAGEAARGLGALAREQRIPVAFGVLTTENREQALRRARPDAGNKGAEAALAALEMVNLYADLLEF